MGVGVRIIPISISDGYSNSIFSKGEDYSVGKVLEKSVYIGLFRDNFNNTAGLSAYMLSLGVNFNNMYTVNQNYKNSDIIMHDVSFAILAFKINIDAGKMSGIGHHHNRSYNRNE